MTTTPSVFPPGTPSVTTRSVTTLVRRPRRAPDPRLVTAAGSVCIAFSPIFIALAGTSPGTATFFRTALALPLLVPLALWERRRLALGRRGLRGTVTLLGGGALLGVDMTLWSESVHDVGAGVSTVLANVQVVIVPVLALIVLGERIRRSFLVAVPVMLVGVALAGGLVGGSAASGPDPVRGTVFGLGAAVAYAGYLLCVRSAARPGERCAPVALASVGAMVAAAAVGSLWQGLDLAPDPASFGWLALLALVSQVIGWVLIASGLGRLPASTGASILLLQPVGAVLLGTVILGEVPSGWQLLGCAVVIGAVAAASRARRVAAPGAPAGDPGRATVSVPSSQ